MVVDRSKRRTAEMRVKLAPDLAEAFSGIASNYGVLPPTMAAVVLGQYVEKVRADGRMARMVALDAAKRLSEVMGSPDSLAPVLERLLSNPEVLTAMSSVQPEAVTHGGGSPVPDRRTQLPPGGERASDRPGGGDRARTAT